MFSCSVRVIHKSLRNNMVRSRKGYLFQVLIKHDRGRLTTMASNNEEKKNDG